MIAALPADTVEGGKDHPFVVALVKELRQRHGAEIGCVHGSLFADDIKLRVHAVRSAVFKEIIGMIENATGKEET